MQLSDSSTARPSTVFERSSRHGLIAHDARTTLVLASCYLQPAYASQQNSRDLPNDGCSLSLSPSPSSWCRQHSSPAGLCAELWQQQRPHSRLASSGARPLPECMARHHLQWIRGYHRHCGASSWPARCALHLRLCLHAKSSTGMPSCLHASTAGTSMLIAPCQVPMITAGHMQAETPPGTACHPWSLLYSQATT